MSLNTFITRSSIIIALCLCALTIYFYVFIPDTDKLKNFLYIINHSDGYASSEEIPNYVKKSFVAAEDNFFYIHQGVDFTALMRAARVLYSTGEKRQGGSTITMQLARNMYLNKHKTFSRKFNEILLAYKIEQAFTKDEILSLYLNKIYFGHNQYGITEASKYYFSKKVSELDVSEAAILASIPPAPARITPILKPEVIMEKRDQILIRLLALKIISPPSYCNAFQKPLKISKKV